MTGIVDEAADALERRHFFASFNQRYAELRGNAEAWTAIEAERADEAALLGDTPA